jgi:hypothetical protein
MVAFAIEFCNVQCVGKGREFEFAVTCDENILRCKWLWYEHEGASLTDFINMLYNENPDMRVKGLRCIFF